MCGTADGRCPTPEPQSPEAVAEEIGIRILDFVYGTWYVRLYGTGTYDPRTGLVHFQLIDIIMEQMASLAYSLQSENVTLSS